MSRFALAALAVGSALALASARAQPQAAAAEISIDSFTRNAAIWSATISPDGRSVAAIQESALGDVLTIIDWRTRTAQVTQLARRERSLHLDWVAWKNNDRVIFALRQEPDFISGRNRPGTTRVYASNRDGSALTLMFGGEISRRLAHEYAPVWVVDLLQDDPNNVLLGTFAQHGYTIYRTDVGTGRVNNIVDYADWDTVEMYVDGEGYPVLREDALSGNAGWQIYRRAPGQRDWVLAYEVRRSTVSANYEFQPLGAGPGPGQVYVAARPAGQEFQAIYLYDTSTGQLGEPIFQHEHADAAVAWLDQNDHSVVVGCGETQRWECRAVQPELQRHLEAISADLGAQVDIALIGMSRDEGVWLIAASGPTMPLSYYIYEVSSRQTSFVASTQPLLPQDALSPMRIVEYSSRDGTALWGYLTEPAGAGPHPLVVLPHGGPEARDSFEFDFYVQFLSWRGYAVFQPNFRGSEGFGRSFAVAGHRQWGRRMQDDVTDGVLHLVDAGVADRQRICIVGASYGGYAALAGASLTPDLYRCAISIAGVSDLLEMLASERREEGRRSTTYAYWTRLIGDPNADRDALVAVSPARQATSIQAPVLLIHGADDGIVPFAQSELMRDALRRAGKQVELVAIADEGHIWSAWSRENRQRLLEETDRFLAQHLRR